MNPMSFLRALSIGAVVFLPATATAAPSSQAKPQPPATLLWRGENLARAKARLRAGDPAMRTAYRALLRDADEAMDLRPFTVMEKHRTPPSGDKHDYMSLAPYWWPDSTKPNG